MGHEIWNVKVFITLNERKLGVTMNASSRSIMSLNVKLSNLGLVILILSNPLHERRDKDFRDGNGEQMSRGNPSGVYLESMLRSCNLVEAGKLILGDNNAELQK